MNDFRLKIEKMNALAESCDGFVWRFKGTFDGSGMDAPYNDSKLFFNLSIWENPESLQHYVFSTPHIVMIRRKNEWVEPDSSSLALWWIEEGKIPTSAEAVARLEALKSGESNEAFTFRNAPPPPSR